MSAAPRRLFFDDFELRLDSGELLKAGSPVKLQPQPMKVLEILASRSGEVLSREELRHLVWGEAFVDFDASLNFSIKEIRRALGDSATSPTFVETIPRRGYRFLKPIRLESASRRWPRLGTAGVLLVLLVLLTILIAGRLRQNPTLPRLAILPLACHSQNPADPQVCGGITEALTAELTQRFPHDLDVIAPTSALAYSGRDAAEIRHGLQADYLLSGDVALQDQGLELKVRLARTTDGKALWQETFPGELKDAPLLYAQIVRGVGRSLELRLPPPKKRPEAGASSPAYQTYLRGLYFQRHEQYEQAAASLQEATLLDPDFAPAYAALALVRVHIPSSDVEVTEAAARRALVLDPNLADAHLVRGKILLHHSRDWKGAGWELRRALALDPGNAEAHHLYSLYLAALGRHAEAIAFAERARRLDPASMLVGSDYAWLFYLDHQYQEAIRQAQLTLKLFPLNAGAAPQVAQSGKNFCESTILYSAWMLGDRETALAAAKALLEGLGYTKYAAHMNDVEEFWPGQERFIESHPVGPYERAKNAMLLGHRDRALDLLTQQCKPQGLWSPDAAVDPVFDDLHADPRWSQVLDCLKLPADAPARR